MQGVLHEEFARIATIEEYVSLDPDSLGAARLLRRQAVSARDQFPNHSPFEPLAPWRRHVPPENGVGTGYQGPRLADGSEPGPIQVGSHYHFFETNPALVFDRDQARGFRLNIPAGTALRFEPGQTRTVELVAYAGDRRVYGFRAAVMGALDDSQ